eukprot:TRINITY_DN2869_c0_g1_i1.p1 TRINITY_DN2869_c0_g1~~TRINITY_DN2869_c0_g1_i1.p1  ORF type:complete len:646 (+),score=109.07 TRINITY_DN2869_c0_g1_i1:22-1938(+)
MNIPLTRNLCMAVALFLAMALAADPTPIATSLDGNSDWQRSMPWVNMIRQARWPFGSPSTPWDGKAPLDPKTGWPTADFGIVLQTDGIHLSGTYKIKFTGKGTVKGEVTDCQAQNANYDPTADTTTVDLVCPPSMDKEGSQIMLGFTGTSGGIKDLVILQPGYTFDQAEDFSTAYLQHISRFETLRFMDLMATNGNPSVHWSDRTPPTQPAWTGPTGIPWENAIKLANAAKRNMWINIPAMADDDYITQLATLLKNQLQDPLIVYYEYSNEVWNWGFPQSHWALNESIFLVTQKGDPYHFDYDKCNNTGYWQWRHTAYMCKHISDIFASVWGKSAINTRVRPILASQVAYTEVLAQGLHYLNDVWGNPKNFIWGIAGAPYFNLGSLNNNPQMTTDQVLQAMRDSIASMAPETCTYLQQYAAWGSIYDLEVRAYEGGPDTFGPNGIDAKYNATTDPRMKDISVSYLDTWYSYGFGPLNWFVAGAGGWRSQYGTWALTDDMKNQNTYKIQAIDQVRSAGRPAVRVGLAVPGTINGGQYTGSGGMMNSTGTVRIPAWWGKSADYLLRVPETKTYQVTVTLASSDGGKIVQVWHKNTQAGQATAGSNGVAPAISVSLTQGVDVVSVSIGNAQSATVAKLTIQ